jgi:hypothetical protein
VDEVPKLYQKQKRGSLKPSFQELSQILQSVIISYTRSFIVIDALDECRSSVEEWELFLSEILHITKTLGGVRLFVTSRFVPDITQMFKGSL